jgi:molybdenum cofactor cytidylyltransferase
MSMRWVTGVVLAAGGPRRLGTPKQLLPYRNTTLLGATLDVARSCGFDQIILTLGAAAQAVCDAVATGGIEVVVVPDAAAGCSASLRAALGRVDPRAAGIVLMLGDQPTLDPPTVRRLVAEGPANPVIVCRYCNGIGHPFWFARAVFGELAQLHGDKGIWKLLDRVAVRELDVAGAVPLDVDTWDDYARLVESVSS